MINTTNILTNLKSKGFTNYRNTDYSYEYRVVSDYTSKPSGKIRISKGDILTLDFGVWMDKSCEYQFTTELIDLLLIQKIIKPI